MRVWLVDRVGYYFILFKLCIRVFVSIAIAQYHPIAKSHCWLTLLTLYFVVRVRQFSLCAECGILLHSACYMVHENINRYISSYNDDNK